MKSAGWRLSSVRDPAYLVREDRESAESDEGGRMGGRSALAAEVREGLSLIGRLQDLVHPRRVDVVFLRPGTDPVLRFEIFPDGV